MDRKKDDRRSSGMLVPTIIAAVAAVVLVCIAYFNGQVQDATFLNRPLRMTVEIIPLLLFAFIIAGMIQIILPRETLVRWIGEESGFRGLLIGSVAGGLTLGGPYVSLPVCAGLLRAGSGIGTMVAFLTGWSLLGISRIPMEIAILGWKFWLIRIASTFFFPPIAGFLAHVMFVGGK
jgi:uncharacterized membrane protein YraQ (UPF0718 family)